MHTRSVTPIIATIALLTLSIFFLNQTTGTAQSQNSNFSELISTLNKRVEQGNGFIFQIVLASYSNPEAAVISLGTGDYEVSELGSDYVCVNRAAGAALTKSCIPFTNIAAITYLDN